jgi:hypothetical protein
MILRTVLEEPVVRVTVYWPTPALLLEPEPTDGPVLVTVRYAVSEENATEFVRAMEAVGRSRRKALTNEQPEIEHLFPADTRSASTGEKERSR